MGKESDQYWYLKAELRRSGKCAITQNGAQNSCRVERLKKHQGKSMDWNNNNKKLILK